MLHWNLPGIYQWLNPSHLGWLYDHVHTLWLFISLLFRLSSIYWSRINHPHLGPTRNHSEGWLERSFNEALGALRPDGFLIPFTVYPSMCSHANTQKTEWHVYVQIICLPKKKNAKIYFKYIQTKKTSEDIWNLVSCPSSWTIFRSKMHWAAFRDLLKGPRAQREVPKSFDLLWYYVTVGRDQHN